MLPPCQASLIRVTSGNIGNMHHDSSGDLLVLNKGGMVRPWIFLYLYRIIHHGLQYPMFLRDFKSCEKVVGEDLSEARSNNSDSLTPEIPVDMGSLSLGRERRLDVTYPPEPLSHAAAVVPPSRPSTLEQSSRPSTLEPSTLELSSRPSALEQSSRPSTLEQSSRPSALEPSSRPSALEQSSRPSALEQSSRSSASEPSSRPSALEQSSRLSASEPPSRLSAPSHLSDLPPLGQLPASLRGGYISNIRSSTFIMMILM
jgi:hypothetical protein